MGIKVLIVDDSALVRKVLKEELAKDPAITIVGTAHDPYVARDMILELTPQILILDVEMPRMDGITFLKKLMPHYPVPAIIVSSLTPKGSALALEALRSGAVDVLCKPDASYTIGDLSRDLIRRIKDIAMSGLKVELLKRPEPARTAPVTELESVPLQTTEKIVAIGASTGGTQAIESLLARFPRNAPGTVIVQHMPERFTSLFAERLNELCAIEVREAQDGDRVSVGLALVAPGNKHLQLKRSGAQYFVRVMDGPLVCRHRPSVDVLFRSVAKAAGGNALGIMLTGMGDDGAEAMLELKNAGGRTVAQNEETCVVFGMPGAAVKLGAAEFVEPLDKIPERIWALLKGSS